MTSWIPKINRLWKQDGKSKPPAGERSYKSSTASDEASDEEITEKQKSGADESPSTAPHEVTTSPTPLASNQPSSSPPPPASLPPPSIPDASDLQSGARDGSNDKIPSLSSKLYRKSSVPPMPVARSSLSGTPPPLGVASPSELDQIKKELFTRFTQIKNGLELKERRIQQLEATIEKEREERTKRSAEQDQRLQVLERGLKKEQDAWSNQVEERDEALFDLKLALETEQARLSDRIDSQNKLVQSLEANLAHLKDRVEDLQRAIELLRVAENSTGDDLTRIKGIGPRFERALKDMGITSYAQIASWTAEDIDRIASRIKIKPERIQREGWVECATELIGLSRQMG
ncbi:MAG: hypothetical protein JXA30_18515 [Deltaproteobacteria bacterium]|nr:hypothetical protein [Deltaproteobacteria bacterium]